MERIIGIDLGTTNSEVAVLDNGQAHVIGDRDEAILPSVVALNDQGELIVGQEAKNLYWRNPQKAIKSIKRKMGTDEKVQLGEREYTPQEISAIILKTLHKRAEAYLKAPVSKAVITVPAYFSDAQRQATRDAGQIAGMEVVRIINEPTAAALTYEANLQTPQKIMVYDLGGGTFDVSIVSTGKGVVEVLSSHGDSHLGGDDFDETLLQHLLQKFEEQHGIDLRDNMQARGRLIRAAEEAKKHLSYHPFATVNENFLEQKDGVQLHLNLEISRHSYEEMISSLLDKTIESVEIALRGAELQRKNIDKIVLVGGATRTPLVAQKLEEYMGQTPYLATHPDLCVAMGAAIQGGIILGEQVSSVLVDITPFTFGTSYFGMLHGMPYPEVYCPIIKRNTALPVSRSQVFYTMHDFQDTVEVKVYQGEHEDAVKNIEIGKFLLRNLSKVPSGNEIIAKFDLDLNGILKVTAVEKRTDKSVQITIDNAISQFEGKQMEDAKANIKKLFGETEINALVSEEWEETTLGQEIATLLNKGQKLVTEEIPAEDCKEIQRLLNEIKSAQLRKDKHAIKKLSDNLADILYYYE